jgi:ribose 5-phosphate isomerase B
MSIAANKHKGIRASVCGDLKSARWTREHNDANVLCMGARIIDAELAKEITDIFLATDFIAGKHKTRVEMLEISQN